MARPTRDDRRRSLLRTGAELAATRALPAAELRAIAQVTIARVASRAGTSRAAVYHLWPTQQAYRLALMDDLRRSQLDRTDETACDPGEEIATTIRDAVQRPWFRASLSFLPFADHLDARNVMADCGDAMVDRVHTATTASLARDGRQLRPEFTADHARSCQRAVLQGTAVLALLKDAQDHPDALDELIEGAQEAIGAIAAHFSEPVTSAAEMS